MKMKFILLMTVLCFGASTDRLCAYSGIIAFGDSLSDRGNMINKVGFNLGPFTGYDFTYYTNQFNAFGTPANGRWSSGPTWIEYLNGNLQASATNAAPIDLGANNGTNTTGANFAWGGSTTAGGTITFFGLHNLQLQVSNYVAISSQPFLPTTSSALYSVWSGGNDAINWVTDNTNTWTMSSLDAQTATSTSNLATAITSLYNNGARSFIVPNMPALGFKPTFVGTTNEYWANTFATNFNTKLDVQLSTLEGSLSGISLVRFDIFSLFNSVINDPNAFGFTNATQQSFTYMNPGPDVIVADPSKYVFWDGTHPTSYTHQHIGNAAYLAITAVPEPSTITSLVAGLFILVSCAVLHRKRVFRKES
ncbi:MAG: SGNH/GDSL hydrolase family protein [Verrucomicrobiota bacterium]|nr:SGNH/GDSL hydrolase family protein [Verrucomicrobiota bacterium]